MTAQREVYKSHDNIEVYKSHDSTEGCIQVT